MEDGQPMQIQKSGFSDSNHCFKESFQKEI
jgi:hypothetical protein